jgi:hypothetical protein
MRGGGHSHVVADNTAIAAGLTMSGTTSSGLCDMVRSSTRDLMRVS